MNVVEFDITKERVAFFKKQFCNPSNTLLGFQRGTTYQFTYEDSTKAKEVLGVDFITEDNYSQDILKLLKAGYSVAFM